MLIVARGFRKPIRLLRSLAMLDGTGHGITSYRVQAEGALSLKDIKGHGGLSIVQDPKTAKYDGMPRSAIAVGAQDFILPVKEMPSLLLNYSKNPQKFKPEEKPIKISTPNEQLEKVFILLRKETGCNFSDYKNSTVIRRIEKRMALNQIDKLGDYINTSTNSHMMTEEIFQEILDWCHLILLGQEAF